MSGKQISVVTMRGYITYLKKCSGCDKVISDPPFLEFGCEPDVYYLCEKCGRSYMRSRHYKKDRAEHMSTS